MWMYVWSETGCDCGCDQWLILIVMVIIVIAIVHKYTYTTASDQTDIVAVRTWSEAVCKIVNSGLIDWDLRLEWLNITMNELSLCWCWTWFGFDLDFGHTEISTNLCKNYILIISKNKTTTLAKQVVKVNRGFQPGRMVSKWKKLK